MKSAPVVFGSKQTTQPFEMLSLPDQTFQPDSGMLSENKVKIILSKPKIIQGN